MLLAVVLGLSYALAVFVLGYFLYIAARNYKAHQFFKLKSPNMPMAPGKNIFSGNMIQMAFHPRNWQILHNWHKDGHETVGAFLGNKPFVSTIDLELIKTMVIDEPNDHPNRTRINIPMDEFEYDCLLFAEDDQWRKLRKAIGPALT